MAENDKKNDKNEDTGLTEDQYKFWETAEKLQKKGKKRWIDYLKERDKDIAQKLVDEWKEFTWENVAEAAWVEDKKLWDFGATKKDWEETTERIKKQYEWLKSKQDKQKTQTTDEIGVEWAETKADLDITAQKDKEEEQWITDKDIAKQEEETFEAKQKAKQTAQVEQQLETLRDRKEQTEDLQERKEYEQEIRDLEERKSEIDREIKDIRQSQKIRNAREKMENVKQNVRYLWTQWAPWESQERIEAMEKQIDDAERKFQETKKIQSKIDELQSINKELSDKEYERRMEKLNGQMEDIQQEMNRQVNDTIQQALNEFSSAEIQGKLESEEEVNEFRKSMINNLDRSVSEIAQDKYEKQKFVLEQMEELQTDMQEEAANAEQDIQNFYDKQKEALWSTSYDDINSMVDRWDLNEWLWETLKRRVKSDTVQWMNKLYEDLNLWTEYQSEIKQKLEWWMTPNAIAKDIIDKEEVQKQIEDKWEWTLEDADETSWEIVNLDWKKVNVVRWEWGKIIKTTPITYSWDETTSSALNKSFTQTEQEARTNRHNNPTAMTVWAAKTAGLEEWTDYVKWDSFKWANGETYYTAKLLWDPIDKTIEAINTMWFKTTSGKDRWSYLDRITTADGTRITDEKWNQMNNNEKKNIIKQMYQNETSNKQENFDWFEQVWTKTRVWEDAVKNENWVQLAEEWLDIGEVVIPWGVAVEVFGSRVSDKEREAVKKAYNALPADKRNRDNLIKYFKWFFPIWLQWRDKYAKLEDKKKKGNLTDEEEQQFQEYNKKINFASDLLSKWREVTSLENIDAAWLSKQIREWKYREAMRKIERLNMQKWDIPEGVNETQTRTTVRRAKKVRKLVDDLEDKAKESNTIPTMWNFGWTLSEWLWRFKSKDATKLRAKMTQLTAQMKKDLLWVEQSQAERESLEGLIPRLWDKTENIKVKIKAAKQMSKQPYNDARNSVWLPKLSDEEIINYDKRLEKYMPSDEENAKVSGKKKERQEQWILQDINEGLKEDKEK